MAQTISGFSSLFIDCCVSGRLSAKRHLSMIVVSHLETLVLYQLCTVSVHRKLRGLLCYAWPAPWFSTCYMNSFQGDENIS